MQWTLLFFALAFADPPATQAPAAAPSETEILEAVQQLGAPKLKAREAASDLLWKAGRASEAALQTAIKSTDAEVRYRAKAILDKFRFGIYPDTPAEILAVIEQYRNGDFNGRLQALQQLKAKGEARALFALLDSEPDVEMRRQLRQRIVFELGNWISVLVEQPELLDVLIEEAATNDAGISTLVMYHVIQGTLDQRLAKAREQHQQTPTPQGAKMLAYLWRAKGELRAAREVARHANDKALELNLSVELEDWKEAGRLADLALTEQFWSRDIVERLGFTAAYHRLAENKQRQDDMIARLKSHAAESPTQAWNCAEAMFINLRPDEGLELAKKSHPAVYFELLCYQHKYREAFAYAGLTADKKPDFTWYMTLPESDPATPSYQVTRLGYALYVARAHYSVGEHSRAAEIFDVVVQAIEKQPTAMQMTLWGQLAQTEYRLGLKDKAFEHAAKTLSDPDRTQVLRALFVTRSAEAEMWWKFLRSRSDDVADLSGMTERNRLAEIDALLNPWIDESKEAVDPLRALAADAAKQVDAMDEKDRGPWLTALAESCAARQLRDLALTYFEAAAKYSDAAALRRADMALEDKDWVTAATWYRSAWERDKQQAVALYLRGYALTKAGDEKEGQAALKQANLLALGVRQRHVLATGLQTRGLLDEARTHLELLLRTGTFGDWYGDDASKRIGDMLGNKEPAKVAAMWERVAMGCLRLSSSFIDPDGYLRFPLLIQKQRALGFIEAKEWEGAQRAIDAALAIIPADVRVAEDLVPAFRKAGRPTDAEALFERCFAPQTKLCEEWPNSATHHNNLAWVAARSHRRLDEALSHAQKAVSLLPRNSAYLDTLAEVYFHRGDRAAAIEHSERSVRLSPRVSVYKEQLQRFKSDELPK